MYDFKFLTVINGVYNFYNRCDDFNIFSRFIIYIDERASIFKIKYNLLFFNADVDFNLKAKEGEIILKDTGTMEVKFLLDIFNDDKKLFKNILFNKFLDYMGDELNYDLIY